MLGIAAVLAACHATPVAPVKTPDPGVSIAMYGTGGGGAFGVVDDRRWIDVTDGQLWLDDIDPGAALPSLVIEALSGAPLQLGACERERMPSLRAAAAATATAAATGPSIGAMTNMPAPPPLPRRYRGRYPRVPMNQVSDAAPAPPAPPGAAGAATYAPEVRCAIVGAPGRRLVRVLYVSTTLAYRGQHDVGLTAATTAHVATRFAIVTPQWRARDGAPVRADVTLFDGVPGGDQAPVQIASGRIAIDGSTAVIAPPPRDVPARVRRVFDGAVDSDASVAQTDPEWNAQPQQSVMVWLELPGTKLAPGPVHVHAELPDDGSRDVVIPTELRKVDVADDAAKTETLRLPLWIDDQLLGNRVRTPVGQGGGRLTERAILSVSNNGEVEREVWIEERMRVAHKRVVDHAWPSKPALHGDTLRTKVTVKPGDIARTVYTIDYTF